LERDPLDDQQLGQILKNKLMDVLSVMNPPLAGLGDVLIQVYRDRGQNEVLRDYAVQHLATYDGQLEATSGSAAVPERQAIQKVMWEALNETSDSIAGTALLGLNRLSTEGADVNQNRLGQMALAMANDNTAEELTRITAWQICAQRNIQDALPTVEGAAQNGATIPQQISAIGALGLLGGPNDLQLLQNLLRGNEERLKLPAQTAISRIAQRLHLQTSAK
jgi:hypothetical protein